MLTDTWLEQTDFVTFSLGEPEEEEEGLDLTSLPAT